MCVIQTVDEYDSDSGCVRSSQQTRVIQTKDVCVIQTVYEYGPDSICVRSSQQARVIQTEDVCDPDSR